MKAIVIDTGTAQENERLTHYVYALTDELDISREIQVIKICRTHAEGYHYLTTHKEIVGVYFVKASTRKELEVLKELQQLKTTSVFMVYTDNDELETEFLDLTLSSLWTLTTVHDDSRLKVMIGKVLKYVFTDLVRMVTVGDVPLAIDSVLYVTTDKRHRNYLHAVLRDNECLARATISELVGQSPSFVRLGRGLLVNTDNIRRLDGDGLTIAFEGTPMRIKAPKSCKKQLKELMLTLGKIYK